MALRGVDRLFLRAVGRKVVRGQDPYTAVLLGVHVSVLLAAAVPFVAVRLRDVALLRGRVLRPLRLVIYLVVGLVHHVAAVQLHLLLGQLPLDGARVEALGLLLVRGHLVGVSDRASRAGDLGLPLDGLDLVDAVPVAGALRHHVLGRHDGVRVLSLAALVDVGGARVCVGLETAITVRALLLVAVGGGRSLAFVVCASIRIIRSGVRMRSIGLSRATVGRLLSLYLYLLTTFLP